MTNKRRGRLSGKEQELEKRRQKRKAREGFRVLWGHPVGGKPSGRNATRTE